jgi:APA family basic amino acid/polyamine antiporter
VFFAYIGFDAVSTAAQEAKNPQRDMPIGILGSLVICTLLYVVVSAVLTGMVSYTELNVPAPMATALERTGAPGWLRILVDVGAVLGLGSVILVMLLGQSRVFFSMSRDGLLGAWAGKVHPKFRTPYLSTIYVGMAVMVATGLLPLQILGQLVNIGTLLAFALVCAGVWILRSKRPELERPFKVPFMPVIPAPRHPLLCRSDGHAADGYLAPAAGVAPDWLRDLLRIRQEAQRTAAGARSWRQNSRRLTGISFTGQ